MSKIFDKILKDVRIELMDEFDLNFQRKAFFEKSWPQTKHPVNRGSLMMRTGALRNSLKASVEGDKVIFTSSKEYASLHNEGGRIKVTPQMKKFFWAMYYKSIGQIKTNKSGKRSQSEGSKRATLDAEYWKSLALMKVGSPISIPERRFIGNHPKVEQAIKTIMDENMKEVAEYISKIMKKK